MIRRWEWVGVVAFALLLAVITTAPYGVGALREVPGWQFSGFILGAEDGHSYIGKMRLGAQGHWRFHLFYTHEPHESAPLTFLPYMVPGWLVGRWIPATDAGLYTALVVAFHVMRILFGSLLVLVLYRFIAVFLDMPGQRAAALVLSTMGGGLGVLLLPTGQTPPEFFIPEAFTFLILLGLPHLALARAALLGGFLALFGAGAAYRTAVLAGLLWLVVGLCVPFYLAVIYILLAVWCAALWLRRRRFPWQRVIHGGVAAGITLPLFAYYAWAFTQNPAFVQWSAQNLLPSPPALHYLLAYAPLLLAALPGVGYAWRAGRITDRWLLVVGWVLAVPLLVYLPINVQRRLGEGVLVPLAILAVAAVGWLPAVGWRRLGYGLLLLLCLPSTVLLYSGTLAAVNSDPAQVMPVFMPTAEVLALNWLDRNAVVVERGAVVLAPYLTGNKVPSLTNLRPYVGHGPETLNSESKRQAVAAFFAGTLPPAQVDALLSHVDYVLSPDALASFPWQQIYAEGGIFIYQRTPG